MLCIGHVFIKGGVQYKGLFLNDPKFRYEGEVYVYGGQNSNFCHIFKHVWFNQGNRHRVWC